MSLSDLKPANTKRAMAMVIKAFERFLFAESTTVKHIRALIVADPSRAGGILVTLLDKFGVYLAFHAGPRGQHLSRHSVAQYYRQVKCWLLDEYPVQGGAVARQLLGMGRTLEQHCIKRESGGFVKKAVACTKEDLKRMTRYIYSMATCASGYQDAALLCLLWYLFGRASDLTFLRKQQFSIGAGGVFFIRFIRMKTSDGQALSLFPDADFLTCPLLALALTLITQDSPCAALLNHLPVQSKDTPVELTDSIPLLDLLEYAGAPAASQRSTSSSVHTTPTVGIHALVNRLLDRVAGPAGVEEPLTSHSFRRSGAQHANASSELSTQWIFDRGAWNLTTTNIAFAYVFNTPKEDHQVAKVLSGMEPKQASVLPTLEVFDSSTQECIREVSNNLFYASHALGNKAFNICAAVRDVLTATILLHYPLLMKTNAQGPVVTTIRRCAEASGVTASNQLAWSYKLTRSTTHQHIAAEDLTERGMKAKAAFDHQTALIERLIEVNRRLEDRVNLLEAANINSGERISANQAIQAKRPRGEDESVPVKRRRRSETILLVDTWFAWCTSILRGWLSTNKHKKSDARQLVAYMKLFIEDGYTLNETLPRYKDDARQLGELASNKVIEYPRAYGVPSTGSNAALKAMRLLHRTGSLNDLIGAYHQRFAVGRIVDPAPEYTRAAFVT